MIQIHPLPISYPFHFQIQHWICKTHIGSPTNPMVDLKLDCMEIGMRWLGDESQYETHISL
jgi:hypothetical protein